MKKNKLRSLIIAISVVVMMLLPIVLFASTAHTHDYTAIDFNNGYVGIKCSTCGDYYKAKFSNYINKKSGTIGYNDILDVVDDNVINAKDYAKLQGEYPAPTSTTKPTTTKSPSTTVDSTDKDGWNNNIIKP